MKQGTSALVAAAIFLGGASAVVAQPLPPVEGPRVIYGSQAHYGGRGGPPPPHAPFDGAMPSYEVAAILRSAGFLPLGGPTRRGGFYVVSAVHPRGDDGRVVIDAYSGRIVRFVPAADVTRASRGDEMVLVYQGPTFPPPAMARGRFLRRLRPWPRARWRRRSRPCVVFPGRRGPCQTWRADRPHRGP